MKIIIIDDDPIVCESLRMITEMGSKKRCSEEIKVVATGTDGKSAVAEDIHSAELAVVQIFCSLIKILRLNSSDDS